MRLRLVALFVLVLGTAAALSIFLWFDHRQVTVDSLSTKVTVLGEPRIGERVGGLLFLASVLAASLLFWAGHLKSRSDD